MERTAGAAPRMGASRRGDFMRASLISLAIVSLAALGYACSARPSDPEPSTSTDTPITKTCNPSHHHPLCPPEGDPRWCDCVLAVDPCVDFGCPDPKQPFCDSTMGCQCGDDWDCKKGSGSSSGG